MKQNGNIPALKWIWNISGKAKLWPVLQTAIRAGQGGIALLYAHALGAVVDAAASGDVDAFSRAFGLFALYNVSSIVLLLLNRYISARSKNALDKAFRMRAFSQLLYRDYGRVSQTHTGEWMNHITSDTDIITKAVSQIIPETIGALVRFIGALLALLRIIPQVTWFLIPGGVIMAAASLIFQKRLKRYHKTVQSADGKVRSFMQERLYSLLVIHSFTQEDATAAMAEGQMDRLNAIRMRRERFTLFCSGMINGAMITAQLLGIGLCGLGILHGSISYGSMSIVLYLINMLESPLSTLSGYISQYYAMIASAERLMDIEKSSLDMPVPPVPQKTVCRCYEERFGAFGMENVDFSYDDGSGNQVLRNFSLHIRKGEFVAFTGDSGCGKSTALKVLLNLFPLDAGRVYRQDADGEKHPLDASWRGLFAYVPQGNQLVSGTVRETLTFFDPERMEQEEKLWQALEIACADSFVRDLPDGLDTVLGERGSGLSEGQMQRLSVARAVLSDRPVLLLDEATSALDPTTEEQLLRNLRAMTNRTVLIITHREAALNFCDKQIHFARNP